MQSPVEAILEACQPHAHKPGLSLKDLVELAASVELTDAQIEALRQPDPDHPYGRRVLMAEPRLEVMVATWTPGFPCAPHDHGGQSGAVRVLRGASRHRIWKVSDGQTRCIKEHVAGRGEMIVAGPDLIHSMGCADPDEPLISLHMYTESVQHMIVYDLERNDTLIVNGYCGAWVPEDGSDQLVARLPGLWDRAAVSAWMKERGGSVDPAVG